MSQKFKLDIPVLLPQIEDTTDACVGRLIATISGRQGVEKAHVAVGTGSLPARLCIHYDPDALPMPRIREIVQAAGAALSQRYGHILWPVEGITHQRRARTIEERLRAMPGVLEAHINVAGPVHVEFDHEQTDEQAIGSVLASMGVVRVDERPSTTPAAGEDHHSHKHREEGHNHEHGGILGSNTELIIALVCGALLAIGFSIEKLTVAAPDWLPIAFYIGAYFLGGFFTLREAIDNLKLRKFEIDTLMLVAAAGAAAMGAWAEGALLLFLFSLGHALEHHAMGRAKRAIEALGQLAPRTATVRRKDGGTSNVPVEQLAVGDLVIVKPDERVAADGFVAQMPEGFRW